MIPTRDIGTRYNGLATVPKFGLHVPASDETTADVRKMLNEVKHLYFDRRYRQCASKCLALLEKDGPDHHPLIRTFLYFYAALSYDTLARSMHNHSVARLPSLQQSEDFYNKALATLPEPLPIHQEGDRPLSPPRLSLSLPAQDDQPKSRQAIPSMWDLTSTFDAFDLSSSASRRHSFNSSKHTRTDSLVTDVSWAGDLDSDPFTDDKHDHKPENNYLSVEPPSVKRPSPLQLRKARSNDSLLSEKSAHTDSPAQTPSRSNEKNSNGLDTAFRFPPPETPPPQTPPPQTHGFVDMVEGTPIQWATPSSQQRQQQRQQQQHLSDYDDTDDEDDRQQGQQQQQDDDDGNDGDPTTPTPARVVRAPVERTHPCPRLLFPRDVSSSSLLPLPLGARIQHYNGDLSSFRAQLVSHLLSVQLLKSANSPASSRSASSSSSKWSEATATNSGGAAEENRRRSGVLMSAPSQQQSETAAAAANGGDGAAAAATNGRGMTPAQKADRIQDGRKRMWARERFDPSGCRELARLALQECEA